MRFDSISPKQAEVFKFAADDYDVLICDGAVRSGKTLCMSVAFIIWAMERFDGCNFGICGKTVRSAERNIILPLTSIKSMENRYRLSYARSLSLLTATYKGRTNYFYIFGGRDESSYTLIQGITLHGVFFDEVALMPRSFVEQAITRALSVDDAKLWFNCNPESPKHWFYLEWILRPEEHNARHLHFLMDDNPSLSKKALQKAQSSFTGVFYDRYILGLWVVAEGLIYPEAAQGKFTVPDDPDRKYTRYYVSIDYGTINPTSMGLWGLSEGVWYRTDEYYYSSREKGKQLTDEEYYAALVEFTRDLPIRSIIIDPSAASFIATIRKHGKYQVRQANNAVVDGIRNTASALQTGAIKICERCSSTISEFSVYRWDEKAAEDRPIKDNDHAMDETRYFVNTVLHSGTASFVSVEI